MTTMTERMARAIRTALGVDWPYSGHEYLLDAARAALEAMKEPTEAMWEEFGADFEYEQFCGYWSRAITAALEEGE